MAKIGRPKKKDAIKAGELKEGLCRFSFIVDIHTVTAIKTEAKKRKIPIKTFMEKIIHNNWPKTDNEIRRAEKETQAIEEAIRQRILRGNRAAYLRNPK